jgi:hypothetical protein
VLEENHEVLRQAAVLAEEAARQDPSWRDFAEAYGLFYEGYQDVIDIATAPPEPFDPDAFENATPFTIPDGQPVREVLNDTCRSLGVVRIEDLPEGDF